MFPYVISRHYSYFIFFGASVCFVGSEKEMFVNTIIMAMRVKKASISQIAISPLPVRRWPRIVLHNFFFCFGLWLPLFV